MSHLISTVSRRSTLLFPRLVKNIRAFSSEPAATKPDAAAPSSSSINRNNATHKVDNLERKMFVWTGKYKTAEEVPAFVNQDVMEKTRNRIRIKVANIMMALTIVGCIIAVISGKKAADRGESVQKANLDWHKEYNEQRTEEARAAQQK